MCRFTALSNDNQISFISSPFTNSHEWYNADETYEETGYEYCSSAGRINIIIVTCAIIMIYIITNIEDLYICHIFKIN